MQDSAKNGTCENATILLELHRISVEIPAAAQVTTYSSRYYCCRNHLAPGRAQDCAITTDRNEVVRSREVVIIKTVLQ